MNIEEETTTITLSEALTEARDYAEQSNAFETAAEFAEARLKGWTRHFEEQRQKIADAQPGEDTSYYDIALITASNAMGVWRLTSEQLRYEAAQ